MATVDYSDSESFFRAIGAGTVPGGIPMPKFVTIEEVRREASQRTAKIFHDWTTLKDILDRHEATISKRWAKKTKAQRLRVLLAAWPGMAASHRPDYVAFRKETPEQRSAGTSYRADYMWPYINQEDMSKPKTLPLFLNARGRATPDAFAISDREFAHLGFVSGAIVRPFLNGWTMYFSGRSTPDRYGELVSWEEDDTGNAFTDMHTQKAVQPGDGLTLLEMQERTYSFLVCCCKEILHDFPPDRLVSDTYPIQPEPAMPEEISSGFASLAVMAVEAPYRLPAKFDLTRLESLLAAKVASTEDHIWALREDPGYFAETLEEHKDHRVESLKDLRGQSLPMFVTMRLGPLWAHIISRCISDAYRMLEVWHELHVQVARLQQLHKKYARELKPDQDLPEDYLLALLKFDYYLNQHGKIPMAHLRNHMLASPPLRPFFARDPERPTRITQKPSVKFSSTEGELIHLLKVIADDGYQLFLATQTVAVDELERFIQSQPGAKEMISPYIANVIADLSIITEATRQLKMFQPWAQMFENQHVDHKDTIEGEFKNRTKAWESFFGLADSTSQNHLVRLGDPSDRKFYHPVDKRRTSDNVEAMRAAEANVDAFWAAADETLRSKMGLDLKSTAVWKLLSRPRILQRTPKWVEPAKGKQVQSNGTGADALAKPLSELYFDLEHRTERTVGRSSNMGPLAPKTKTRGSATASDDTAELEAIPPSAQPDFQPKFAIDARALKVFRTLFYTPSVSATPGEIVWTDFLHAMSSTGFMIEKLYGSVWQFQPTKLDVERSIQFHEPHPSGKLAYRVARRFGRRLERAYGWVGTMFELREKK